MLDKLKRLLDSLNSYYFKIAIIESKHKHDWVTKEPHIACININIELSKSLLKTNEPNISVQNIIQNLLLQNKNHKFIFFYNFEMLFRQEYNFDLVSFLKEKSKTQKYAIIWPGQIQNGRLVYSSSDRSDYYTHTVDNYLIYKEDQ